MGPGRCSLIPVGRLHPRALAGFQIPVCPKPERERGAHLCRAPELVHDPNTGGRTRFIFNPHSGRLRALHGSKQLVHWGVRGLLPHLWGVRSSALRGGSPLRTRTCVTVTAAARLPSPSRQSSVFTLQ